MRAHIAVVLPAVCVLLVLTVPVCTQDYVTQSVPQDAPYFADLERCYQLGLLVGYDDGTYRPDEILTRAELWVAFSRLLDISRAQGISLPNDLDAIFASYGRGTRDHWAITSFERLVRCGLIESPPMPMVRDFDAGIQRIEFAEVAVHTMRAYGMLPDDLCPVEVAISGDIMVRQPDGDFHMREGMPRWEFAVAMNRLLDQIFPTG